MGWLAIDKQQRQTAMSTVKLRFSPHYSRHSGYAANRWDAINWHERDDSRRVKKKERMARKMKHAAIRAAG